MLPYIALAITVGTLLPVQALLNAAISQSMGGPIVAGLSNFIAGLLSFVIIILILRVPLPSVAQAATVPWWMWCGGVIGALFIFSTSLVIPQLGAASTFTLLLTGQLIASVALDHYGVLHQAVPVTYAKILGLALLFAGAYLITRP